MSRTYMATVEARIDPLPGARILWLHCPGMAEVARAGQFVMVRPRSRFDPYLRLPAPIHRLAANGLAIWLQAVDPAYESLLRLEVGQHVDLLGPCGRALDVPAAPHRVALVGQGAALGALIALTDIAPTGQRPDDPSPRDRVVHLVASAGTERQVLPKELLPQGIEYSVHVGIAQQRAFWQAVAATVRWADALYAAGSSSLYRPLRRLVESERVVVPKGFAQAWVWRDMACGTGLCRGCLVRTRAGLRRACVYGPFFDLLDLDAD
jgi:dihydroorotate dehydrogenase electron transfer subunit